MKYSIASISVLVALAVSAKPNFLNTKFDVVENKEFTLKFDNCANGCTIVLQKGPKDQKKDVKTLTKNAKDGSFTFTPSDLPSGSYSFKISDNNGDPKDVNYSSPFEYTGTGPALTTDASSASTASDKTSDASSTSSSATATVSSAVSSTGSSTITSAASVTNSTTRAASSSGQSSTTVPNGGARPTPFAIVAGAIAAVAYLG